MSPQSKTVLVLMSAVRLYFSDSPPQRCSRAAWSVWAEASAHRMEHFNEKKNVEQEQCVKIFACFSWSSTKWSPLHWSRPLAYSVVSRKANLETSKFPKTARVQRHRRSTGRRSGRFSLSIWKRGISSLSKLPSSVLSLARREVVTQLLRELCNTRFKHSITFTTRRSRLLAPVMLILVYTTTSKKKSPLLQLLISAGWSTP